MNSNRPVDFKPTHHATDAIVASVLLDGVFLYRSWPAATLEQAGKLDDRYWERTTPAEAAETMKQAAVPSFGVKLTQTQSDTLQARMEDQPGLANSTLKGLA